MEGHRGSEDLLERREFADRRVGPRLPPGHQPEVQADVTSDLGGTSRVTALAGLRTAPGLPRPRPRAPIRGRGNAHPPESPLEVRQGVANEHPRLLEVQVPVLVDEEVALSDELRPRDPGVRPLRRPSDLARGLSHDLEGVRHDLLRPRIPPECFFADPYLPPDRSEVLENVGDPLRVSPGSNAHSGIISINT